VYVGIAEGSGFWASCFFLAGDFRTPPRCAAADGEKLDRQRHSTTASGANFNQNPDMDPLDRAMEDPSNGMLSEWRVDPIIAS
jgi:hypothetical protein